MGSPYDLRLASRKPEDIMQTFAAKRGDRAANLRRALESLRAEAKDDADYLAVPANAARLADARRSEESDVKYCWR